jgi:hypothetical protein
MRDKKEKDCKVQAFPYLPIYSITVAMMKIVAKKPNETPNPTPASVASFRVLCTFFSKVFTITPPNSQF